MNTSDVVAVFALLISGLSLLISKRSLDQSKNALSQGDRIRRLEKKNEVLALISDCRTELDETSAAIGALQADFNAEKQPVQTLLVGRTKIFSETLPLIEMALQEMEQEWAAVQSWTEDISFEDMRRRQAQLRDQIKDYQRTKDVFSEQVQDFRTKIEEARSYSNKVT